MRFLRVPERRFQVAVFGEFVRVPVVSRLKNGEAQTAFASTLVVVTVRRTNHVNLVDRENDCTCGQRVGDSL